MRSSLQEANQGRAGAWGEEAESEILPTVRAGFAVFERKRLGQDPANRDTRSRQVIV